MPIVGESTLAISSDKRAKMLLKLVGKEIAKQRVRAFKERKAKEVLTNALIDVW